MLLYLCLYDLFYFLPYMCFVLLLLTLSSFSSSPSFQLYEFDLVFAKKYPFAAFNVLGVAFITFEYDELTWWMYFCAREWECKTTLSYQFAHIL